VGAGLLNLALFHAISPGYQVDAAGTVLEGTCSGNLVLADSWPGQMRFAMASPIKA
jgi:hypothetical protein